MENIRHISIFNEFKFSFYNVPLTGYVKDYLKQLNVITLNKSLNYKIKNLTIDIGYIFSNLTDVNLDIFRVPIRFILDNDPISTESNNLIASGMSVSYNGLSLPSGIIIPSSQDIVDSSNSDFRNNIYFNTFSGTGSGVNWNLSSKKSNTISEYNFFNFSSIIYGTQANPILQRNSTLSNNEIADFDFKSNNFQYLNISLYPYISTNSPYSPPSLIPYFYCEFIYSINFDLLEESP